MKKADFQAVFGHFNGVFIFETASNTNPTIMKKTILLLALPFLSFSQNEKGASPLANPSRDLGPIHNPQSTRAVVIGISDYREPQIPDLRFADKDALAFANFLRSPAGGSLDNDHLEVLTNQNATAGLVAAALDALIEQTKAGDEVKILSCQPTEFSLEGEQWGGGRGVFSYHLVDGLAGLADRNGDGQVSVGEINRYLGQHVNDEAAPLRALPEWPVLMGKHFATQSKD